MDACFQCSVCGSANEIWVDPSAGEEQEFIQDCQVCCRPNLVRARWGEEGEWELEASFEE